MLDRRNTRRVFWFYFIFSTCRQVLNFFFSFIYCTGSGSFSVGIAVTLKKKRNIQIRNTHTRIGESIVERLETAIVRPKKRKRNKEYYYYYYRKKNLNGCTIVRNETREFGRLLQFKRNGTIVHRQQGQRDSIV